MSVAVVLALSSRLAQLRLCFERVALWLAALLPSGAWKPLRHSCVDKRVDKLCLRHWVLRGDAAKRLPLTDCRCELCVEPDRDHSHSSASAPRVALAAMSSDAASSSSSGTLKRKHEQIEAASSVTTGGHAMDTSAHAATATAAAGSSASASASAAGATCESDSTKKRARLTAVPVTAADLAHFETQLKTARAAEARAAAAAAAASSSSRLSSAAASTPAAATAAAAAAAAAAASLSGWKGARIVVDTLIEVLPSGEALVHLDVAFDGVSRRAAKKLQRAEISSAKHRDKKGAQKAKQKAKRGAAHQLKLEEAAKMKEEGKTEEEIRAHFRALSNKAGKSSTRSGQSEHTRAFLC